MPRLVASSAVLLAAALVVWLAQPSDNVVRASLKLARTAMTGVATITTDTLVIPTYNYSAYLAAPVQTTYGVPYQKLNWSVYNANKSKADRSYTRLTLENDYLRVTLLPELGGRVHELIFKPTGSNELYKNAVIKPTGWGPTEQGWWLAAGGIEWGLPVEEHGYESAIAWSYSIAQSSAGVTVTLRDSTQADRLRAAVDVFLPDDRAVLIIRPKIENGRGVPLDFKWWNNAMLAPGPGNTVGPELRFIFPIDAVTVHSTGDRRLPGYNPPPGGPDQWIAWPTYNGVDWSRLGNFDQWFGFFGRPAAQQDFVGVVDTAANEGVVRVFPRAVATGIKGFAMGWLHPIGWGEWTDDGSTYVELHGGLAPTFWDSAHLDAGQSVEWEETWYPLAGIGAFSAANAEAALKVEQTGSTLNLGVFSTRARTAARLSVFQRSTCSLVGQFNIASIDPATPQTFTVSTSIPLSDLAVLFTEGNSLILGYNEKDCVAPASSVDALPAVTTSTGFSVAWSGSDFYSGVASHDIQFKDGHDGGWTTWLTATAQVSGTFSGQHGHTYFFRSRARDVQGNLEAYANDEWGDAFTSALTSPAAVMETSRKVAPRYFAPGQMVSYTVVLSNTGNLAGSVTLTDTLPLSMTLITDSLITSSGSPPTFDGARILWSGTVTDGESVFLTYALTPTLDLAFMRPLTNTLVVEGGVAPVTRTAVTSMARLVYLPIMARLSMP